MAAYSIEQASNKLYIKQSKIKLTNYKIFYIFLKFDKKSFCIIELTKNVKFAWIILYLLNNFSFY